MGRKPRFGREDFIGAALKIISEKGPDALTVAGLAARAGAPVGSVYHRFISREVLMAELWVSIAESFQRGFLEELERGGEQAALYTLRWVRKHPNEGRVLLLYRREELKSGRWPDEIKEQVASLGSALDKGIRTFVKKRLGVLNRENVRRAVFALTDVPLAAVKPHLQQGERPPVFIDRLVLDTYRAVVGGEGK